MVIARFLQAQVNRGGSLCSTKHSEYTKPKWLLCSICSYPPRPPFLRTKVSRKVVGWRSHNEALEVYLS